MYQGGDDRFFRFSGFVTAKKIDLSRSRPSKVKAEQRREDEDHGEEVEGDEDGGLEGERAEGRDGNDAGGQEGRNVADGRKDDGGPGTTENFSDLVLKLL